MSIFMRRPTPYNIMAGIHFSDDGTPKNIINHEDTVTLFSLHTWHEEVVNSDECSSPVKHSERSNEEERQQNVKENQNICTESHGFQPGTSNMEQSCNEKYYTGM